jgi:hypothetical protein
VSAHVPVAPNEIDVVPLHCGGGGVVQVTPRHTLAQWPVAPSHAWPVSAQSTAVGG